MKLTKSKLKKIIKEELKNILLNEDDEKRTRYLCIEWFDELDERETTRINKEYQSSNPGKPRPPAEDWNNYLSKWGNCPHKPPKVTVYTTKTRPKE